MARVVNKASEAIAYHVFHGHPLGLIEGIDA